jgi:predicted Zn finger-like uncharacterized protein
MTFNCPSCGTALTIPDEHAGKNVKCPTCSHVFLSPDDSAPVAIAAETSELPVIDVGGPGSTFAPYVRKRNAPGAVASLVWGILGLFICGFIFGIVAITQANSAKKLIAANPELYTGEGIATAGMVMGIIDLVGWGLAMLIRFAVMAS